MDGYRCGNCGAETENKSKLYAVYNHVGRYIYCLDCLGRHIIAGVRPVAMNEQGFDVVRRYNDFVIFDIVRLDKDLE